MYAPPGPPLAPDLVAVDRRMDRLVRLPESRDQAIKVARKVYLEIVRQKEGDKAAKDALKLGDDLRILHQFVALFKHKARFRTKTTRLRRSAA